MRIASPGFVFSANSRLDSVYWVDATTGSPPARLARKPGKERPGLRFFSYGSARKALEDLIRVVEQGEIPPDLNIGAQYEQKTLLPALRQLHIHWGTTATAAAISAARDEYQNNHSILFREQFSVFSKALPMAATGGESWLVENVSLGGFQAYFNNSPGDRLKLGTAAGRILAGKP